MYKVGDEVSVKGEITKVCESGVVVKAHYFGEAYFDRSNMDLIGKNYAQGLEDAWEEARERLAMYEDIGTVSEFRELKEKATAKKPNDITELKGDFGTVGKCPCCNGITDDTYCYCDDCGQKLDWSEGKE